MKSNHVQKIEDELVRLRSVLRELTDDEGFEDFLRIIHRPGWTTPVEAMLIEGSLQSMTALAFALNDLRLHTFAGAQAVGVEEAAH